MPHAILEYQKAVAKAPNIPGVHYALGNAYWKENDLDKAEHEFKEELKLSPENYLATWKVGNIYLSRQQFDQALIYLQKALEQKPDLGQAHRDLAKLYLRTHKPDLAVSQLKMVAELDPREASAHYLLSQAYRELGRASDQKTEMDLFEKLKKDEEERGKPPEILGTGAADEPNEEKPEAPAGK
jgi:tetratricopeptide (TPR) repeat protein